MCVHKCVLVPVTFSSFHKIFAHFEYAVVDVLLSSMRFQTYIEHTSTHMKREKIVLPHSDLPFTRITLKTHSAFKCLCKCFFVLSCCEQHNDFSFFTVYSSLGTVWCAFDWSRHSRLCVNMILFIAVIFSADSHGI